MVVGNLQNYITLSGVIPVLINLANIFTTRVKLLQCILQILTHLLTTRSICEYFVLEDGTYELMTAINVYDSDPTIIGLTVQCLVQLAEHHCK